MRDIETELNAISINISYRTVSTMLDSMGGIQSNKIKKMLQVGEPHPDRNAQFEHINKTAKEYLESDDAGGSNGYNRRMWKFGLQQLADYTGLEIEVSHFPLGTSKWNKIEHRLFCYISKNWQGKPAY